MGNFGKYLLIVLLAAGIVAIGAHEIAQRKGRSAGGGGKFFGSADSLVKELQGNSELERARMSPETITKVEDKARQRKGIVPHISEKKESDALDRSDREQLDKLLGTLAAPVKDK